MPRAFQFLCADPCGLSAPVHKKLGRVSWILFFLFLHSQSSGQTSVYSFDLSASKDTSVTTASIARNGAFCGGTNCVKFDIVLNPGSDLLELEIVSGAAPNGSEFYQINCAPTQYSLATPVCITGLTNVSITFCKPGNNSNNYRISASSAVKGSADLTLRQNCSGTMSVTGLTAASVVWKSVFPGTPGQYNNYLSCTSGCVSNTVTPLAGAPPYIDYAVSGTTTCAGTRSDTIRVYTAPALSVPITPSNPAICSGASATLTASPTGGNTPYTYLWSSGQTTSTITTATTGTFTVTVSDNTSGCTPVSQAVVVTAAPTPVAPTASGASICSGGTATLTATAPGGTYRWYDVASGGSPLATGSSYTTPSLTATKTYYVETTVSACTSSRTAVTVTVNAIPAAPTAAGATICEGSTTTLTATAPGGTYDWFDAASGGNLLVSNAAYTTPALTSTTTYYVQTTIAGCSSARTAVTATVNPIPSAPVAAPGAICTGFSTTLTATSPGGTYRWYDAATGGALLATSSGYATPNLNASTTYYVQTTVAGCTSSRTAVTVTVNAKPAVPVVSPVAICSGNTATLQATPTAGIAYRWFDAAGGNNLLATNDNYTTPSLTANATYYVEAAAGGCYSNRAAVAVTVNAVPAAPTVAGASICSGATTTLTATAPGGAYRWYDAATGGSLLATNASYTTPALSATVSYYVDATVSGCTSGRTMVNVSVNPVPAIPTAAGSTICSGNATSLTATAPGGTYEWYDALSGGNLLVTNSNYITPVLTASATYYVQTTVAGCTSPRHAVSVTVKPIPAAPTAAGTSVCEGNAALLSATAPGGIYQWYDAAAGGNLLATNATLVTSSLSQNTTYYVQATVAACAGPRTAVTVTVNATPAAPTAADALICSGSSVILNATAPGNTFEWYDAATGGNLLAINTAYTTPALTASTNYYVRAVVAGCAGPRKTVAVTLLPVQDPGFDYGSGTFCITGNNPVPVVNALSGGTFTSSPAGLVFVSTTTGEINVSASALGTYTITFLANGSCGYSSTANVTITTSPNASFSYNGPYCQLQNAPAPLFVPGASGGTFSATPSGLQFTSSSTGVINLNTSAAGTYTITNNIPAQGGCAAATAVSTVTINTAPVVNAGPDQTVCAGVTVNLNGTIGGAATNASWSGGNGSFSNASSLTTRYTPAAGETVVKLYLLTDDPSGPCNAAKDSLTLFITPTPAAPVVQGGSSCVGSAATLVATAPGGNYQWFDVASGGSAIASGQTFTTPVLNAQAVYYVQTTINNCTGARLPVTVAVTPRPTVTSPAAASICSGSAMFYEITSDLTGADFTWSRPQLAGIAGPAVTGSDAIIAETLNNQTSSSIPVTYTILPGKNNCQGTPFNYTVMVNPSPAAPAVSSSFPVCAGTPLSLSTATVAGATFSWTGPNGFSSADQNPVITNITTASAGIYSLIITVDGCASPAGSKNIFPVIAVPVAVNNGPVCEGNTIQLGAGNLAGATYSWTGPGGFASALQNPSINPGKKTDAGTYYVTASIAGCSGMTDSTTVVVNTPPGTPAISASTPVCAGDSIVLAATTIAGAAYKWVGPGGFSSSAQTPVISKAGTGNDGTYQVTVSTQGCSVTRSSSVAVVVNKRPDVPSAIGNTPLCEGDKLSLLTPSVTGAVYHWSHANGFTSQLQNPVINAVSRSDSGTYRITVSVNGCTSDTGKTRVTVIQPAVATAGNDQVVCGNNASVRLDGKISGEDTQTGIWTTEGSGTFLPKNTSLRATYLPSKNDTAKGSVVLKLSTTQNKTCAVSTSALSVIITDAPVANAGPDQAVCANDSLITLNGLITIAGGGNWTTSGTGTFNKAGNNLGLVYTPSRKDILAGNVFFYLTTTGNGDCIAVADTVKATIIPEPYVNAGADRLMFENDTIVLAPDVRGTNLSYSWSPDSDLNSGTIKNPVLRGRNSATYVLKVTGEGSCTAQDDVFVKVLKPIGIPNIFSPNGDGINDTWEIKELANYPNPSVEIFTRSGQKIFTSVGYSVPWDGTYNGKPVPVATYYYIVDPKILGKVFSGSVTVIR
ncbi:gliding motility-associated C-terminal domain-containing protein [Sediminibacterium roseum]|uniref:Gliding motility-associated C-terminal domain-containing protein n=1 Tax=Sediminibacterium roseum TaxID=1978412 RepID=A0ABX0A1A0_9BACT|nr:gliding motility-associated C-terminal domain-containing protein [Sediminibacterium roseum]NCI52078.1 gliding motility-associated C-terminal domain-containing protein [Sediminibacterium roseum]